MGDQATPSRSPGEGGGSPTGDGGPRRDVASWAARWQEGAPVASLTDMTGLRARAARTAARAGRRALRQARRTGHDRTGEAAGGQAASVVSLASRARAAWRLAAAARRHKTPIGLAMALACSLAVLVAVRRRRRRRA